MKPDGTREPGEIVNGIYLVVAPTCPDCSHPIDDAHQDRADGTCERCDDAAQVGAYAPCQTVDHIPAGAELDDDPEALAAELIAEYAAAVERVRERAAEARAGGRYLVRHPVADAISGPRDLAELVRRDRVHARIQLASRQADEMLGRPLRDTPIGAAALAASADQQTRSARP